VCEKIRWREISLARERQRCEENRVESVSVV
jgi:hypothetical protein